MMKKSRNLLRNLLDKSNCSDTDQTINDETEDFSNENYKILFNTEEMNNEEPNKENIQDLNPVTESVKSIQKKTVKMCQVVEVYTPIEPVEALKNTIGDEKEDKVLVQEDVDEKKEGHVTLELMAMNENEQASMIHAKNLSKDDQGQVKDDNQSKEISVPNLSESADDLKTTIDYSTEKVDQVSRAELTSTNLQFESELVNEIEKHESKQGLNSSSIMIVAGLAIAATALSVESIEMNDSLLENNIHKIENQILVNEANERTRKNSDSQMISSTHDSTSMVEEHNVANSPPDVQLSNIDINEVMMITEETKTIGSTLADKDMSVFDCSRDVPSQECSSQETNEIMIDTVITKTVVSLTEIPVVNCDEGSIMLDQDSMDKNATLETDFDNSMAHLGDNLLGKEETIINVNVEEVSKEIILEQAAEYIIEDTDDDVMQRSIEDQNAIIKEKSFEITNDQEFLKKNATNDLLQPELFTEPIQSVIFQESAFADLVESIHQKNVIHEEVIVASIIQEPSLKMNVVDDENFKFLESNYTHKEEGDEIIGNLIEENTIFVETNDIHDALQSNLIKSISREESSVSVAEFNGESLRTDQSIIPQECEPIVEQQSVINRQPTEQDGVVSTSLVKNQLIETISNETFRNSQDLTFMTAPTYHSSKSSSVIMTPEALIPELQNHHSQVERDELIFNTVLPAIKVAANCRQSLDESSILMNTKKSDFPLTPRRATSLHLDESPSPFSTKSSSRLSSWKGQTKKKRLVDMSNIRGLFDLMTDKSEALEHNFTALQTSSKILLLEEDSNDMRIAATEFKSKYIALAGDLVILSRSIVATWIPFAKQSSDRVLSQKLLASLTKVDVFAGQLRAVKNTKNYKENDFDEGGQVLAAASNLFISTKDSLESLEAIRMTIGESSFENLKVELQIQ